MTKVLRFIFIIPFTILACAFIWSAYGIRFICFIMEAFGELWLPMYSLIFNRRTAPLKNWWLYLKSDWKDLFTTNYLNI